MSALIIRLEAVRHYVDQAERHGRDEPRRAIVDRALADIRAGHHPFVPPMGDLARIQRSGQQPEPRR